MAAMASDGLASHCGHQRILVGYDAFAAVYVVEGRGRATEGGGIPQRVHAAGQGVWRAARLQALSLPLRRRRVSEPTYYHGEAHGAVRTISRYQRSTKWAS